MNLSRTFPAGKSKESKNVPGKWEPRTFISQMYFKLCTADAKQGLLSDSH